MTHRGSFVVDDGRHVAFDRVGSGPPVVLCHGTPWSSWVWHSLVPLLSEHRTVYMWDMVGYGRSDKSPGIVSLDVQTDLLCALVDHWGLTEPAVVAHDFGGAVALRAHLLAGLDVRSITVIDPVMMRPWGSPFFELVRQHADVFAQLPRRIHRALVAEYVTTTGGPPLTDIEIDALVAPWVGDEASQAAFYRQIQQADERYTAEVEPLLHQVSAPTHIVWGDEDQWLPVEQAHRLHAAIPGSQLTIIPGAGHLLPLQNARHLAELILRSDLD